ncbi:MAG TPA: RpiB/LacA/LacB family sugar-phosphate isomerase [Kofleriaceae bacterium]|nr:RpiB/LacA/LacB family sugar-phosphate isomerase [Kofleriaceae bacterium]
MIRRLGALRGKRIIFGYDRYLLADLEEYRAALAAHGTIVELVDTGHIHYLSSAELVCRAVQADDESFGVLCCGTGMGMSIAANKFESIYAARCTTVDDAEMSRQINNANVLCIASKLGLDINRAIIDTFALTPYNGRKLEELEYITQFERPTAAQSSKTLRRIA